MTFSQLHTSRAKRQSVGVVLLELDFLLPEMSPFLYWSCSWGGGECTIYNLGQGSTVRRNSTTFKKVGDLLCSEDCTTALSVQAHWLNGSLKFWNHDLLKHHLYWLSHINIPQVTSNFLFGRLFHKESITNLSCNTWH